MLFEEFYQSSEVIFPLLLVIFGVGSLAFQSLLESALEKYAERADAEKSYFSMNSILGRMAKRRRLSFSMTFVGIFWLLQNLI